MHRIFEQKDVLHEIVKHLPPAYYFRLRRVTGRHNDILPSHFQSAIHDPDVIRAHLLQVQTHSPGDAIREPLVVGSQAQCLEKRLEAIDRQKRGCYFTGLGHSLADHIISSPMLSGNIVMWARGRVEDTVHILNVATDQTFTICNSNGLKIRCARMSDTTLFMLATYRMSSRPVICMLDLSTLNDPSPARNELTVEDFLRVTLETPLGAVEAYATHQQRFAWLKGGISKSYRVSIYDQHSSQHWAFKSGFIEETGRRRPVYGLILHDNLHVTILCSTYHWDPCLIVKRVSPNGILSTHTFPQNNWFLDKRWYAGHYWPLDQMLVTSTGQPGHFHIRFQQGSQRSEATSEILSYLMVMHDNHCQVTMLAPACAVWKDKCYAELVNETGLAMGIRALSKDPPYTLGRTHYARDFAEMWFVNDSVAVGFFLGKHGTKRGIHIAAFDESVVRSRKLPWIGFPASMRDDTKSGKPFLDTVRLVH